MSDIIDDPFGLQSAEMIPRDELLVDMLVPYDFNNFSVMVSYEELDLRSKIYLGKYIHRGEARFAILMKNPVSIQPVLFLSDEESVITLLVYMVEFYSNGEHRDKASTLLFLAMNTLLDEVMKYFRNEHFTSQTNASTFSKHKPILRAQKK